MFVDDDEIAVWKVRRRWINLVCGTLGASLGVVFALGFWASKTYECPSRVEAAEDQADMWAHGAKRTVLLETAPQESGRVCSDALSALMEPQTPASAEFNSWFDPWGQRWQIRCHGDTVVTIRSLGPDGELGSRDDILRVIEFPR